MRVTKEQRLANYRAGESGARQRLDAIQEAQRERYAAQRERYAARLKVRRLGYRTLAALLFIAGIVALGFAVDDLVTAANDTPPQGASPLIWGLLSLPCFILVYEIASWATKVMPFEDWLESIQQPTSEEDPL